MDTNLDHLLMDVQPIASGKNEERIKTFVLNTG